MKTKIKTRIAIKDTNQASNQHQLKNKLFTDERKWVNKKLLTSKTFQLLWNESERGSENVPPLET